MFMSMSKLLSKRKVWRKITASLMAFMMWLHPVQAYDTDIITTLSGVVSTTHPNVLFVLDTSNSMNIPTAWHALTLEESATYNSHMEYLWNDIDFISSIGCKYGRSDCTNYANDPTKVGKDDPALNSKMLTYDDILTRSWLPQGYFDPVATKNNALQYAKDINPGDTLPRYMVRNYGGYDYYGDIGLCGKTNQNSDICTRPLRSRFVWYSDNPLILNAGPTSQYNPARPDLFPTVDPRLYSNSFNRFVGADAVTSFSGKLQQGSLLRGGTSYWNPRGVNEGSNAIDVDKLQIDGNKVNGQYNVCVSSYIDQISQADTLKATKAFIPSTVYAPSPFPLNDGYLVSGWFRHQPFVNAKGINLDKYPGLFGQTQASNNFNGDQVGHRDQEGLMHNPVRIADTLTYSGWEPLRADLGGGQAFFEAVYGYDYGAGKIYNAQWPEYGNPQSSDPDGLRSSPTKLAGVLEYYGINKQSVNTNSPNAQIIQQISSTSSATPSVLLKDVVNSGRPWMPDFWMHTPQDDPFYTYMALRGGANLRQESRPGFGGNDIEGPAGKLYGLSTYIDVQNGAQPGDVQSCTATCGLTPGNTSTLIPTQPNAINSSQDASGQRFYNFEPPITCTRTDNDPDCNATCYPNEKQIVVRNIKQCIWTDRNGTSSGESQTFTYTGGKCQSYCSGDCENFAAPYNGRPIGNNALSLGEPYSIGPLTQVCDYNRKTIGGVLTEEPEDTTNDKGLCTLKAPINSQVGNATVSCADYYANTGTVHPNCKTYASPTAAANCPSSVTGSKKTNGATTTTYPVYSLQTRPGTVQNECSTDDGRVVTNKYLANQITSFNNGDSTPSYMSEAHGPSSSTDKQYGSSGASMAKGQNNAVVYSANYLNYLYGPKSTPDKAQPGSQIKTPIARQTRLQIAKDVLISIVDQQKGAFNFGLMAFNKFDEGNSNANDYIGGHVVFPVSNLDGDSTLVTANVANTTDLAEFKKRVLWLEAKSKTPLVETMYEAYLYYKGDTPSDVAKSYYDNKTIPAHLQLDNIIKGGNYYSPIEATTSGVGYNNPPPAYCQKNIIILITDGGAEADLGSDQAVQSLTATTMKAISWDDLSAQARADPNNPNPNAKEAPTSTGQFADFDADPTGSQPYGPVDDIDRSKDNYSWLDELTYFMYHGNVYGKSTKNTNRNFVTTYTIGFGGVSSPVLKHAGRSWISGGTYQDADSATNLADSIKSALGDARSYIPTLSSPTVPISALSKAQDSSDIYVSSVKLADGESMWGGNMKKYHLEYGEAACGQDPNGQGIRLCLGGVTSDKEKNVAHSITDSNGTYTTFKDGAQSYWSTRADGANPLKGGVMDRLKADYPDPTEKPPGDGVGMRKMWTYLTDLYDRKESRANMTQVTYLNIKDTEVLKLGLAAAKASVTDPMKYTLINKLLGADVDPTDAKTDKSCTDPLLGPCKKWGSLNRHTAPLHSPGVVLTYKYGGGKDSNGNSIKADQLLFYSTINGVLHAVKTSDKVGDPDNGGKEIWSFAPEETILNFPTHPDNADIVGGAQQSTQGPIALLDGQPVLYTRGSQGTGGQVNYTQAILIFGMRRGGSGYYALDVKDQKNPKFLWKIVGGQGQPGAGRLCIVGEPCKAAPEYDELGQTWSTPTVVRLNTTLGSTYGTGLNPRSSSTSGSNGRVQALVFGGGWSPRQDCLVPAANDDGRLPADKKYNDNDCQYLPTTKAPLDNMGRAVYVVDVENGEPIKVFTRKDVAKSMNAQSGAVAARISEIVHISGTTDVPNTENDGQVTGGNSPSGIDMSNSIPGTVGAFNVDGNAANTADRLYVGDMGGVLWRFDIKDVNPANWRGYPIASLSTVDPRTKLTLNDRPILFTPTLLLSLDNAALSSGNGQKYDYVYVATGDMEHPTIVGRGVNNKLFMIKDWENRLPKTVTGNRVDAKDLLPVIVGKGDVTATDGHLTDWNCGNKGEGVSCLLNISAADTLGKNGSPRTIAMDYYDLNKSGPKAKSYDELSGWYIDLDINSDGKMDLPKDRREIATSGVLIYKDENPDSATYGYSVLNFSTFRYGLNSKANTCVATGEGRLWSMEATTGVAFIYPTVAGSKSTAARGGANLAARFGDKVAGGFEQGSTVSASVVGQPALKIINCQVLKVGLSGADLSSSYVGPACTAKKTYWFNQYSN